VSYVVDNKKKIIRDLALAVLVALSMATYGTRRYGKGHVSYNDSEDILSQQTRNDIYKLIEQNEGSHFRKICRELDKKMGVVQYHLNVLEKNGLIRSVKDGRYKCFFATSKGSSTDYKPQQDLNPEQKQVREIVITAMKRDTPKKIIDHLRENQHGSHQDLARISEVSPQAITFHCQRLLELGIIGSDKMGRQKYYSLSPAVVAILKFI
jgi:predicted transcriptional regulator